jgi:hypothetical protein
MAFSLARLFLTLWELFIFDFQGNQDQAVEKLQQLQSNSNPAAQNLVPGKEIKDVSGVKPSLVCPFILAL